jgi:hypothetical protein
MNKHWYMILRENDAKTEPVGSISKDFDELDRIVTRCNNDEAKLRGSVDPRLIYNYYIVILEPVE